MNYDLIVFYHIFANANYKEILDFHLTELKLSGLYERCQEINFGLVYKDRKDLRYVQNLISTDQKLNLYHFRRFHDLPTKLLPSSNLSCNIEMGEGETIMKMVDFAKNHKDVDKHQYIFLHTKGASQPKGEMNRAMVRMLLPSAPKIKDIDIVRKKILKIISKNIIHDWQEHLKKFSSEKSLYYYIWNFFWIKGSLLKLFDDKKYQKYTFRGQTSDPFSSAAVRGTNRGRHYTACFPLGMFELKNKKRIFNTNFLCQSKNLGVYL